MKLNEIKVNRKFNLGNYESIDIGVSVSPAPEDETKGIHELIEEMIVNIRAVKEAMAENGQI